MRIFTIAIFCTFFLNFSSFGQMVAANDRNKEIASAVAAYKEATSQSQNLYNGRQYYVYDNRSEEHQFYEFRKWHNGVLVYDDQRFDSIPMLYDIFKDELIIKHFNGDHLLLQSEKIDYFYVDNHTFVRQEAGKDINPQMRTGFYDLIYNGKSRTIVRRIKQRQEKIVDKRVIALFPQKNTYYVKKGDQYYNVSSKKSAFNLFPEYKRELRKVLKDERIKFRKNKEVAIVKMVEAYDKLAKL